MPHRLKSVPSSFHNQYSNSSNRPTHILDNSRVNRHSHSPDETLTNHPRFQFDARGSRTNRKDTARHAKQRNKAVWAHALVLFSVIGIPLSQGVWIEHYYTRVLRNKSLVAISIIPAVQILCIFAMPTLVGWFYHVRGPRSGWRYMFCVAAVVAICAVLPLQWCKNYILVMILQGPVLGAALGTLFALGTLVLSSHYKFNLPLVSVQGGSMGFAGAVVYSVVAKWGGDYAHAATAGIMAITLGAATLMLGRVDPSREPSRIALRMPGMMGSIWKEKGTIPFILGYLLVFYSIFVFPVYVSLNLRDSDVNIWTLTTTLIASAVSACVSAGPMVRKRLGPVNTFIAAAIFSGLLPTLPVWMPNTWVGIIAGGAYGIGLGVIVALHIKVSTVFHTENAVWHPDMPARAAILMTLGGLSAFMGLIIYAVLVKCIENGERIASAVTAGTMVVGGVLVGIARWRRCSKFAIVI